MIIKIKRIAEFSFNIQWLFNPYWQTKNYIGKGCNKIQAIKFYRELNKDASLLESKNLVEEIASKYNLEFK